MKQVTGRFVGEPFVAKRVNQSRFTTGVGSPAKILRAERRGLNLLL